MLKDFRTLLKKLLLTGRTVNIDGLGYFFLAAQSKGTDLPEDFTAADICFRADSEIRLSTSTSTRTDGLVLKDVDRINAEKTDGDGGGGEGEGEDPSV